MGSTWSLKSSTKTTPARCAVSEAVPRLRMFVAVNSYLASVTADLVRRSLLAARASFTFETVMSSPDKVAFLGEAQDAGYRAYLYDVSADDPAINVSRVEAWVAEGGHDVPTDKIISRYGRSMGLLLDALERTDRAYLFDNSGTGAVWLADVTGGTEIVVRVPGVPEWFRTYVGDPMRPTNSETL